jgi:hypothetical protein
MHQSHTPTLPDVQRCGLRTVGEEPFYLTKVATRHQKGNAPKVLWANTEVIRSHQNGTVTSSLAAAVQHLLARVLDRGCSFQRMPSIAMKKQQVDEEHQDQDPSEGADDGGAGWGVEADREVDPQGGSSGHRMPSRSDPPKFGVTYSRTMEGRERNSRQRMLKNCSNPRSPA